MKAESDRCMSSRLGAAALVMIGLMITGLAQASGAIQIDAVTLPIEPMVPDVPEPFAVGVLLDCRDVLERAALAGPGGPGMTTVALRADSSEFVPVVLDAAEKQVGADACPDPQRTVTVPFGGTVAVSRDAPAMVALPINLTVSVSPDVPGRSGPPPAAATVVVRAAYVALLQVATDSTVATTSDQKATVPVTLTNFGNGPTRVQFLLANAATLPAGVQVVLPSSTDLTDAGTNGSSQTVLLHVHVGPLAGRGEFPVQLEITPALTDDPSLRGDPVTLTVLIRHDEGLPLGNALASASLPGLLALLGVGLTAAVAKVRHRA